MRYRPPKVGVVSTLLDNPQSLADSGIDVWVWAKTTIDKVHDESLLAYYDETEARIPLLEYCEYAMPRVDHINLVPGKWLFIIGPANHRWLQFVHIPVDNPYIELPTGRLWRGVSQWHYNGLPLEFDCRPMRYAASRAEKESKGEDWIGSATDFALRHMRRRVEAKTKR